MAYWLLLPLTFSIGLLVYVYAIDPHQRSNRLFALLMLCIALNAIASFVTATSDLQALAQWANLIHTLLSFSVTGVVVLLWAIEWIWQDSRRPGRIRWYTVIALCCAVLVAIITLTDHFGITRKLFYGPMEYVSETGYVYLPGRWYIVLDLFRFVPAWSALGILARYLISNKNQQAAWLPILLGLLFMPATRILLEMIVRQPFPGIDIVGDFLLIIAFAYATSRHLFAPVETMMPQLIDSLPHGIIVLDVDGQVMRMNKAAEQLLDITGHQIKQRQLETLYASSREKTASPVLDSLLETIQNRSEQTYDNEEEIRHGPAHHHVRLWINPVRNRKNDVIGYLILLTDVTTMRHHQEHLERELANQKKLTATMTELASPVLPIMEQIIVLPLMGNLDVNRTELISDVLLNGIKTHHARMIIIDLTGVQQITSGAVYAFSESLDAARLLGAVPILVGIQAQVAEALSDLDIGTLDVEMDLQAGLKHATAALEKNPR